MNQFFSTIIGSWGQLGVTLFIIISSWFTIDKGIQRIKTSKALSISFTAWGYGILIFCIVAWLHNSIPLNVVIKNWLTPIYPYGYWFVSTFVVFYLSLPALTTVVINLPTRSLKYYCIVGGLLIPTYNFFFDNVGGTLAYFFYVFILVGYLKRNTENWLHKNCRLIACLTTIIIVFCVVAGSIVSRYWGGEKVLNQLVRFHDSRNILTLVQAISIFYIFIGFKPFFSRLTNEVAKTALGTYLITENIIIRGDSENRSILWNGLFHFNDMYHESKFFICYALISILIVFALSVIIDYMRQVIGRKLNISIKLVEKLDKWSSDSFDDSDVLDK